MALPSFTPLELLTTGIAIKRIILCILSCSLFKCSSLENLKSFNTSVASFGLVSSFKSSIYSLNLNSFFLPIKQNGTERNQFAVKESPSFCLNQIEFAEGFLNLPKSKYSLNNTYGSQIIKTQHICTSKEKSLSLEVVTDLVFS